VSATPDESAEWWSTTDVAAYLGVKVGTVSSYRLRGQMPPAELTVGRTQLWRPATIIAWHGHRPRPGVGGRPEGSASGAPTTTGGSAQPQPTPTGDPRPDDATAWKVHGYRPLYESEWIRLGLTDVELPDGERFEHHTVWMPAAAMTAVLNDAGTHVLLMWRHRFVPDVWNWELPGGLVEDGEDPAVTAAREVEEETGYRPRTLDHVVTFEPMIGMVHSPHHVYVGHGVEYVGEPLEKTEMQRMEWVPVSDLERIIREGLVRNSGTLVALLYLMAHPPQ
jgi:8-oxo-dGTP pyrophosphatase MutT (NUDIX family)